MTTWTVNKIDDFEDDDKEQVVSMACDDEILVMGVKGFAGEARLYDIKTGKLKTTFRCNDSGDSPNQFSHNEYINVFLTNKNIITYESSENSLWIWDREGKLVAKDPHKNEEEHEELQRLMAMDEEERDIAFAELAKGMTEEQVFGLAMQCAAGIAASDKMIECITVTDDGKIYAGLEEGFLIIAEVEGSWKIIEENPLDYKVNRISVDGKWIALNQADTSTIRLWNEELQEFSEDHKDLELKYFEKMWLHYPFIFIAGKNIDKYGIDIFSFETGLLVREMLKEGKRQYRSMHSNGKLLAICEEVHDWRDSDEWRKMENLDVALYDLAQLVDENVKNEDLWNFTAIFSVKDMEKEYIVGALSEKNLVVNYMRTKHMLFSIE